MAGPVPNKVNIDEILGYITQIAGEEKAAKLAKTFQQFNTAVTERKAKMAPKKEPDLFSPEYIQQVAAQFFLPQVMAQSNAPFQTGINTLRNLQAKAGLLESPFALSSEAGMRGQQVTGAAGEAFRRAMGLSESRVNAQAGAGNIMAQIQPVFGTEALGPLKQALGTYAAYKGYLGQQQQSPYQVPWQSGRM